MHKVAHAHKKLFHGLGLLTGMLALLAAIFPAGYPARALGTQGEAALAFPGPYTLFLPAVANGQSHAASPSPTPTPKSTPGTPPTATPPPSSGSAGFFLPWVIQGEAHATDGPSLAVDANGGVHVAYTAYTSDAGGNRPAYYTYCPANCTSAANFSDPVIFNGKIDHVNLALDPQGRPRLMWIGIDPLLEKLGAYMYAVCNTGCTSAANWQTARIHVLDNTLPHSSRFFAVDPQGHPGLVYYQDQIGAASGTYFASCENSCLNPASWVKTQMTTAELRFSVLAFTSTGLPRIAASFTDYTVEPALEFMIYLECAAGCQVFSQGLAIPLKTCYLCNTPGGFLDLALDASDRPRIALYTGSLDPGRGLDASTLYYLYCSTNCGDQNLADWDGYSLGLPAGVGTYARLAINPQGLPRLVYEDVSYGLQYAWCQSGCETYTPAWSTMLADSSATLDQTEPVPPIPPCQVAGWFTGKRPSLAFDTAGNPRIAYDAEHWQGLEPVNYPPGSPGCPGFKMDQINARFTIFPQP